MSATKTIRTIPQERTPMPEQPPDERVKNFFEVALGYGVEHAIREADRCLDCADPRCLKGCPVSVDIPHFLRKLTQKDFRGAYDVLASTNVLPAICGRVCPQEDQCEGMCSVGDALEPVAIGRLERWLGDRAIALGWSNEAPVEPNGFKVGIVGSGPAGMACAADLARLGCEVTVFEALHAPGGVLRYGIPEFRLPNQVIDAEIRKLERLGVKIECNTLVGRLFTLEQMLDEQGFHALFVATGAGLPKFMGIAGEGLNGVVSANELLTRCNLMQAGKFPVYDTPLGLGRRVAVIGAGNTAMDALRVSRRLGAEAVLCVYRRSRTECPARAEELHHAEQERVEFHWLTNPVAILDDGHGRVRGLRCQRMQLADADASGRRKPEPIAGSEFELDVDTVVYAIGTNANPIIGQTSQIERNRWGYIGTNAELETSIAGVFAGGDIVTGSATVILAMGAGRRAARGIARYLGLAYDTDGSAPQPGSFHVASHSHNFVRLRARLATPQAPFLPALVRPYLPISRTRHPFPLVLVDEPLPANSPVRSLKDLMSAALAVSQHAGVDAEATLEVALLERTAYELERVMRELHDEDNAAAAGDLSDLSLRAQARLTGAADRGPATSPERRLQLKAACAALAGALPTGVVVSCGRRGAELLLAHLRRQHELARLRELRAELAALDDALARVERCDFMTTQRAWTGEQLGLALGPGAAAFDLASLSELLTPRRAAAAAPPRTTRVQALRSALARSEVLRLPPEARVFRSCQDAMSALDERLRDLDALLAAMHDAHLEIRGQVVARSGHGGHSGSRRAFATADGARALLPPSLLLLSADGPDGLEGAEQARLLELLATDLPIKVLCTSGSLIPAGMPLSLWSHSGVPGGNAALLASACLGIEGVHVVQLAVSELERCADELARALSAPGPALIAVYTGERDPTLPAYMAAATACAARIFPTVVRPAGGPIELAANPAPDAAWPTVHGRAEDARLQRVAISESWTAAHVLMSWPAFAGELRALVHSDWSDEQQPVGPALERLVGPQPDGQAEPAEGREHAEHATGGEDMALYVNMVDARDTWLRGLVPAPVLAYALHVLAHWRTLQRAAQPAQPFEGRPSEAAAPAAAEPEITAVVPKPAAAGAAASASTAPAVSPALSPAAGETEAAAPSGAAYVETARCSSCDECIKRAPGLFVYDADKRAVLRKPASGSYRELVEAAEHCKMAIIHPGQPWDETEPDLEELQRRAALFG